MTDSNINHLYNDKTCLKASDYTFLNKKLNCVSGIFSYGDTEGVVWHGLTPSNEHSTPQFASGQDAMDAYFKEEYEKYGKTKVCHW